MSATSTIAFVTVTVGASAALGVAHMQGWGAFGEFQQSMPPVTESCKAPVSATSWSKGAGARSIAETRALIIWSKRATRLGSRYASWHNARSRDVTCTKVSSQSTKCTVRGRPCQRSARINPDRIEF